MRLFSRRCFSMAFSHRSGQYGQSAVEMALVLPLLLLILFGIIVSVFMLQAYDQVSNAAREGARAGSMYRITQAGSGLSLDDAVRMAIYDDKGTVPKTDDVSALGSLLATSPSFDVTGTDVTCTLNGIICSDFDNNNLPRPGDRVRVKITYRYTMPVVSEALPMFPQPIVIAREVVMEVQ
jgi:hypothetical protein